MMVNHIQELGIIDPLDNIADDLKHLSSAVMKAIFATELRAERRVNKSIPVYYQCPGQTIPWTISETVNISANGLCIRIDQALAVGDTIEIEVGRKLMDTREVFKMKGRVVGVTVVNDNRMLCHIAFQEKTVVFHRVNNVLWSLADINSWFLEKYTADCQGLDVEDLEELKAAYNLVYQEYAARKLCVPNPEQMFFNAYSFVPGSRTFILKQSEKLLGTICMVADSPMGLPMESLFAPEIDKLRQEGRKMVEIGALSLNSKYINMKQYSFKNFKKQAYLYKLYKTMFDYVRGSENITDLIIGCHPRHEFLYKYLTFETLSAPKNYQGANAAPAVLMRMDIHRFKRMTDLLKEGPGMYFFKDLKYKKSFNYQFSVPSSFVNAMLRNSPFWKGFAPAQQKHLKEIHAIVE